MTSPVDNTALLVMDVQDMIVERFGDTAVLERLAAAVASARSRGLRVIFVRVAFRAGFPEVRPRNAGGGMPEDPVGIHPAVAPADGEVVVTKRRVSAFAGSDFDVLLRDPEIHRVLTEKVFRTQAEVVDVATWTASS
jgi:nicotinamidase-related amidase